MEAGEGQSECFVELVGVLADTDFEVGGRFAEDGAEF